CAQERIDRQFACQGGRQGGAAGSPGIQRPGRVRRDVGIARFGGGGKAQVAQRVLVRAADQGVGRQGRQLAQRGMHFFGAALEQASATGAEQGIAAEEQRRSVQVAGKGDVAGGVA